MAFENKVVFHKLPLIYRKRLSLGVVIPCHNNAFGIYGVLRSLDFQSVRPETVVVVDDNSDPTEERRVRSVCDAFGARYSKLPAPRNGLEALGRRSHARNLGTHCLDTDIVLYLDGDMLLGPRYIEEIKFYHAVFRKIYARGRRYSIPPDYQANGLDVCLDAIKEERMPMELSSPGYVNQPESYLGEWLYGTAYCDRWEWCASNNLSVRRVYVSHIGYWDEEYYGWGEEDIDFSYRLYRRGVTPLLLNSDNAISYHLDHHIDYCKNEGSLRANGKYLISKYPEIRQFRVAAYALYNVDIEAG